MKNPVLVALLAIFVAKVCNALGSDWEQLKVCQPKGYVCVRAARPIQIDGQIQEEAWRSAPWTEEFADIEGAKKPKPRFRTRAKMLWDDDYFYVAAELEEPHLSATLTQRDSVIFFDNDFEMFIDPNGDNHEYYELEMNALNTVWDLFLKTPYKDKGQALNAWDIAGLKTAVHLDGTLNDPSDIDKRWTVELALPWKALGEFAHCPSPPHAGDQWRVNFSRVEWEYKVARGKYQKVRNNKEDYWVWSPQGIIDMHRPEKWGYVQFSSAIPGEAKFQPDPAASTRDLLMEIYYAERDFHLKAKHWTGALSDLALQKPKDQSAPPLIKLEATEDGFQATAEFKMPSGPPQRWHVRQDSRLWKD